MQQKVKLKGTQTHMSATKSQLKGTQKHIENIEMCQINLQRQHKPCICCLCGRFFNKNQGKIKIIKKIKRVKFAEVLK